MICPKCELGEIKKVVFKKNERMAFLCESCGTVWTDDENISAQTGHLIQSQTRDGDTDYSFIDVEDGNEDNRSVRYPKFK